MPKQEINEADLKRGAANKQRESDFTPASRPGPVRESESVRNAVRDVKPIADRAASGRSGEPRDIPASRDVPSFRKGGLKRKAGMARLHKGERVVKRSRRRKRGRGTKRGHGGR
jgi:hypothetical protein